MPRRLRLKAVPRRSRLMPCDWRRSELDLGAGLSLINEKGMDYDAVTDLLYHNSGLPGVSGISDDMRKLLANPAPEAREAVELFIYRIGRQLDSVAAHSAVLMQWSSPAE